MRDLYNCTDFYILTSPVEGCNHTIFEAMACGIPCIVSWAGYFWDFWDRRAGYKVNWDNFQEHARIIKVINVKKTNPRQVIIDQKLDLESWKKTWEEFIDEHFSAKP